jgi:uroporphyrinogen-III synthase
MRLLVTRPDPEAERTAATLRARGHEVFLAPLLRIELLSDVDLGPGPWAGVLVTSANAARAIAAHPRRAELLPLPAYAVGRRSAEVLRAVGFEHVTSADGDVRDLIRLVADQERAAPLLYLAGEDVSTDLGSIVRTVVVYRAAMAAEFPPDIRAAGALDGVLHYSRRTAEAYLGCARRAGLMAEALASMHFCLSPAIAALLEQAGARRIAVAARPDDAALLDLVAATAGDR